VFITGSIIGYFFWKDHARPEIKAPVLVNLGRVVAQVGGGRFIRTDVQLEIVSHDYTSLFQTRHVEVLEGVRRGFGQVHADDIYTAEGKINAQKAIAQQVNQVFDAPLVQDVYFSGFMIAKN